MRKNKPRIAILLGTRPEIVKMSPLIRLFLRSRTDFFLIHSDQHYSYPMDRLFFKELELPRPDYQILLKRESPLYAASQVASMMAKVEPILLKERPRYVLVQGDTNTVLAGALTVNRLSLIQGRHRFPIHLGHVEAGLRSFDRNMPEEFNRYVADHLSDFLFAPTDVSRTNLIKEGMDQKKIFVTGNTVVDAIHQNLRIAHKQTNPMKRMRLKRGQYCVLTLHRPENVDNPARLNQILRSLGRFHRATGLAILFPIHPRTKSRLRDFNIKLADGIRMILPVGYLDFLRLEEDARLILTDSGGIQEEACVLKVPCVTLRENTERPETVSCGANRLAGFRPDGIYRTACAMLEIKPRWKHAFGDGRTAERIHRTLRAHS